MQDENQSYAELCINELLVRVEVIEAQQHQHKPIDNAASVVFMPDNGSPNNEARSKLFIKF